MRDNPWRKAMRERLAKVRTQETPPQQIRSEPSQTDLQCWIAEAAYYRAESRGFQPGYETEDWLAAEAEISARVRTGRGLI
jgi:hypothetical protein